MASFAHKTLMFVKSHLYRTRDAEDTYGKHRSVSNEKSRVVAMRVQTWFDADTLIRRVTEKVTTLQG